MVRGCMRGALGRGGGGVLGVGRRSGIGTSLAGILGLWVSLGVVARGLGRRDLFEREIRLRGREECVVAVMTRCQLARVLMPTWKPSLSNTAK